LAHRNDSPTNFEWYNDQLPDKILCFYIGNDDCTTKKIEHKILKITVTIAAPGNTEISALKEEP